MRLPVVSLAAACVLAAVPALAQQARYTPVQQRSAAASGAGLTEAQLAPVRNALTAAQQRLQQLGYHTAPTGQWNADTANAVELFQSDHGLRPTGEVDLPTLAALGINLNAGGPATAMLAPEPGQQSAMLPPEPSAEQEAVARFQNSPAYNLPIFTTEGDHPSPPQTRDQAGPFSVMGVPEALTVSRSGRIPGVTPSAPTEDILR